ncbi:MAG: hypothetical protein RSC75_12905 [Bacteroidales bacterium]
MQDVYQKQSYTSPPVGYEPFYINYIGRHGSRNPISDEYMEYVENVLKDADSKFLLTNKGKELIGQIDMITARCKGKWGILSSKGEDEIRGIAKRMTDNFPQVFGEHIYAQSDNIERCIKSMNIFLEEITMKAGGDNITKETYPEHNAVLNFFDVNLAYIKYKKEGIWKKDYEIYADSILGHSRFLYQLFMPAYADSMDNKIDFLRSFFQIYTVLPNTELDINHENFLSGEEIYNLWDVENVRRYLEMGPSPVGEGLQTNIAFPLLEDFIVTSYNAIVEGGVSADLRFAHAETLAPFAALLGIPEASAQLTDLAEVSKYWKDFQITPMAANIQWIFYSNPDGNILVKMLLNEKEVKFPFDSDWAPYYEWESIMNYYQDILEKITVIPSYSIEQKIKYYKVD